MPDSHHDTAAAQPRTTRLADYRPPAFLVEQVDLTFDLDETANRVASRLSLRRNPAADPAAPLHLDGEDLTLVRVALNGETLGANQYQLVDGNLIIAGLPDTCTLEIETRIDPAANTELSGLYVSKGSFFTQCEAEGFRRMTFFPDRPDVMSRYSTTIHADKARVPVLLSNGNLVAAGDLPEGRHFARWEDPHPKPAYLFALVAGDLVALKDGFTTRSGREVELGIWVRPGDEHACGHAMTSLKKSMAWDEEVFGLEYDLDIFNIAAVSDFNMGAMENKGLNVFNTKYVLARPETATDTDYQGIESVTAHDTDPFVRWESGQHFAASAQLDMVAAIQAGQVPTVDAALIQAMASTLDQEPAFAAEALALPGEATLADRMDTIDPDAIHIARDTARQAIGHALADRLRALYDDLTDKSGYTIDGPAIGRRALRNTCLSYLVASGDRSAIALAKAQFDAAQNMTDVLAALGILSGVDCSERLEALAAFYQSWRNDPLVLDKWFGIQALSPLPGTVQAVTVLKTHPDFDMRNPNRVRALIGSFAVNQVRFHDASGAGYRLYTDTILQLDPTNGQVAARMVAPLGQWRRVDAGRQALMKAELQRILDLPGLSRNTFEMASKSLA